MCGVLCMVHVCVFAAYCLRYVLCMFSRCSVVARRVSAGIPSFGCHEPFYVEWS